MLCNWNENNLNTLTRTNWRASLVPAAAVIPAPIAYIKVVAVKTSVVEFRALFVVSSQDEYCFSRAILLLANHCALY